MSPVLEAVVEPEVSRGATRDIERELEDVDDPQISPEVGGIRGADSIGERMSDGQTVSLTPEMDGDGDLASAGQTGAGLRAGGAAAGATAAGRGSAVGGLAKVALGGAVAVGILSGVQSVANASPLFRKQTDILSKALSLYMRPFGRAIGSAIRPFAEEGLEMAKNFNRIASEQGLSVAVEKGLENPAQQTASNLIVGTPRTNAEAAARTRAGELAEEDVSDTFTPSDVFGAGVSIPFAGAERFTVGDVATLSIPQTLRTSGQIANAGLERAGLPGVAPIAPKPSELLQGAEQFGAGVGGRAAEGIDDDAVGPLNKAERGRLRGAIRDDNQLSEQEIKRLADDTRATKEELRRIREVLETIERNGGTLSDRNLNTVFGKTNERWGTERNSRTK
jgi:hypothetical protein